eukprot:TRINITY_DN2285_c4_g2_i2.p1 TRINITY_DN2285_c4_g2~~TRINITY_DN2285_c4_g2_i2.p1  ORF type:complete len:298 (+),score=76.84 TRINITY_DN2285_c4_g2_i2:97-894(+)
MAIQASTSPLREAHERKLAEQNLDKFTIQRRNIAENFRNFKIDTIERNEQFDRMARGERRKVTTELEARQRALEDEAEELEKRYKKEVKKKKRKVGKLTEVEKAELLQKKEIVDLTWLHVKECNTLLKQRGKVNNLMNSSESSSYNEGDIGDQAGYLMDLDDPRLDQVRARDQEIDDLADEMLVGIRRLRGLLEQQGEIMDEQEDMLDDLVNRVSDVTEDIVTINDKLKRTLRKLRSGRDFCCDVILFVGIIAIGVIIYFMVSGD